MRDRAGVKWIVLWVGLGVPALGAAAAQTTVLDYGAFFESDAARIEAASSRAWEAGLWRDWTWQVLDPERSREVFAKGSEEGRASWAALLLLVVGAGTNAPPDSLRHVPLDSSYFLSFRNVLFNRVFREPLAAADAAWVERTVRRLPTAFEAFYGEFPSLLEEEAERERAVDRGEYEGAVLELLLAIAFQQQRVGGVEARIQVGPLALGLFEDSATAPAAADTDPFFERDDVGRFYPLYELLERLPDEEHPVVGRNLHPRVAGVLLQLVQEDNANGEAAAWMLANERPLSEGAAAAIFERCGGGRYRCEEGTLERLYWGPDDEGLEEIQERVDGWIAESLFLGRRERREICARRSRLLESVGGVMSKRSPAAGQLREMEDEIVRRRGSMNAALDLASRIDSPSPAVLDAAMSYWSVERDKRSQTLLERAGMLEASVVAATAEASAAGDCLLSGQGPRVTYLER